MSRLRRTVLVLAAIAVVVAIDVAWLAPASLLDSRLADMTGGAIRLSEADGTLWSGRGVVVAGAARLPVTWRVEPLPPRMGEVRVQAMSDSGAGAAPRADITIGRNSLSLHSVDLTLPASLIATTTGRMKAGAVGGEVSVKSTGMDWMRPESHGETQLLWRGARLTFVDGAAPLDLGDMQLKLTADGDRLSGPVANEGGDLDVRGEVTIRAVDGIRLLLTLAPRRSDNARLALALAAIGTADGAGWRVNWRLPFK